jgi:D-serine deaminase-like pyridoxal phosphate-dependent protein
MFSFVNTLPANPGDCTPLSQVDTPALVVPRKALHRNLKRMQDFVEQHNKNQQKAGAVTHLSYRPHTKTHKCPTLAKIQIEEYGAIGVCVQVLDEAQAMVDGGVLDVFVSNQIVGVKKIARLCDLAKRGKISVIVDNMDNLTDIAAAAVRNGAHIDVLIEVNAGQDRCGVEVTQEGGVSTCVQLAKTVLDCPQLSFKGIHCYHGGIQHTRKAEERRQQVLDGPVTRANIAVSALEAEGIPVQVVTGGGTGTFPFESASGRYTEIQPGSYCFMDVDYGDNEDGKNTFENALFLHSTVISKTVIEGDQGVARVVLDAGTKASSYDSGLPVPLSGWVCGGPSNRLSSDIADMHNGGDEHSVLMGNHARSLDVGNTLRLIPGHIDPTVNMHQYLVIVDDADGESEGSGEPVVVDIWSISGRSPGF